MTAVAAIEPPTTTRSSAPCVPSIPGNADAGTASHLPKTIDGSYSSEHRWYAGSSSTVLGFGPHTCLGGHVARAEMIHGVGALLSRFPSMRLDPDVPAPRIIGLYERGPDAVRVLLEG